VSIESAHIAIAAIAGVGTCLGGFAAFLAVLTRRSTKRIEVSLNGRIDQLIAALKGTPGT
jgi:hypothetical protein